MLLSHFHTTLYAQVIAHILLRLNAESRIAISLTLVHTICTSTHTVHRVNYTLVYFAHLNLSLSIGKENLGITAIDDVGSHLESILQPSLVDALLPCKSVKRCVLLVGTCIVVIYHLSCLEVHHLSGFRTRIVFVSEEVAAKRHNSHTATWVAVLERVVRVEQRRFVYGQTVGAGVSGKKIP